MQEDIPIPQWYKDTRSIFAAQQSDVFLLHGNVLDYPCIPLENMTKFISRMIRSEALYATKEASEELFDQMDTMTREEAISNRRIICSYSISTGLQFNSDKQEKSFDSYMDEEQNAFAKKSNYKPVEALSKIDKYFESSYKNKPSLVLIIKRADLIFKEMANPTPDDKYAVDTICEWAERGISNKESWNRVFLLASNIENIYEGLRQGRLSEIKISMPERITRMWFIDRVLNTMNPKSKVSLEEGLSIDDMASITGSLTLRGIEDVVYQGSLWEEKIVTRAMAQKRKDELVRQMYGGVMEIEYPELTFEDIVGFEDLKEYMTNYVLEKLVKRDPMCPKGCLLAGPPGCTKTAIARALANDMKLPLVMVRMDLIKDKYVGESNKRMARLTEGIEALAPCIVLFDEIDKMFGGQDNTGVTEELQGALQTFINDIPRGMVYFIGTSNYPEVIPPALIRPGRMDKVIPMLPQHLDNKRDRVLISLARRMKLQHNLTDLEWLRIGNQATMFTGADLELLISEADICRSLREKEVEQRGDVTIEDFEEALQNVVPTVESEMAMQALRMATNMRFIPKPLKQAVEQIKKSPGEISGLDINLN